MVDDIRDSLAEKEELLGTTKMAEEEDVRPQIIENNNNDDNVTDLTCDATNQTCDVIAAAEIETEHSEHKTSDHKKISLTVSLQQCTVEINDDNVDCQANSDSTDRLDTVSLSEPCCRVCQCNSKEEILISPCLCSGSVKWIHESCLIQWMKCSLKDSCELCTKKIKITKQKKPFTKWRLPSQRPTPVLWVLVFVTTIGLNFASVVKEASRLCSTTPCLVFYAVGCIGIFLGTLFLIYWSKRAKMFLCHWVELNEEWVIVSEKDKQQQHNHEGARTYTDGEGDSKFDTKFDSCSVTIDT